MGKMTMSKFDLSLPKRDKWRTSARVVSFDKNTITLYLSLTDSEQVFQITPNLPYWLFREDIDFLFSMPIENARRKQFGDLMEWGDFEVMGYTHWTMDEIGNRLSDIFSENESETPVYLQRYLMNVGIVFDKAKPFPLVKYHHVRMEYNDLFAEFSVRISDFPITNRGLQGVFFNPVLTVSPKIVAEGLMSVDDFGKEFGDGSWSIRLIKPHYQRLWNEETAQIDARSMLKNVFQEYQNVE